MPLRMGALYDALRMDPNITEDAARAAAEEVADYNGRIAAIDARLTLLTWMTGTLMTIVLLNFGATIAVLYRMAGS